MIWIVFFLLLIGYLVMLRRVEKIEEYIRTERVNHAN